MAQVNNFYLGTFIVYLLIVLSIGVWGYTRTNSVDDFWVYGRELGPWLATWSFVANFVSAVSVIGFIGSVYGGGYYIMTGIIFGLMLGISCLYFVVHKVRELNHVTMSDIIVDVTGREWSRPITASVLLGNDWVYLILQLVGASLLVTTVTGVPYEYMIWVIGVVFVGYTVLGGLVSVAWTDLIQGVIMVVTVFATLAFMIIDLGGIANFNAQFTAMDPANVAPLGRGEYTILGLIGSIIAFFGTIFTGQNYIIRINATRDIKTAKIHLAASGVVLTFFYSALILLGGATTVALDNAGLNVQNVDRAFPVLITEYLPTGIGIIIILAVMSAILSTTDTRLHATGVTAAHDLYDYFASDPSDAQLLRVSRYATILFGLTATAMAVDPPGTIISLYSFRAVLLTSAFLLPVYGALYWRGLNGRAIMLSMVLGTILGVGWQLAGGLFSVPPTLIGVGVAALALFVGHLLWSEDTTSRPTASD